MRWTVQIEDEQYEAQDLDVLTQWIFEGRVHQNHYVYHPLLQRWMYVRELEELKNVFTVRHNVAKARSDQRVWFVTGGIIVVLWVIASLLVGPSGNHSQTSDSSYSDSTDTQTRRYSVHYNVTGTAQSADITVSTPSGTEQRMVILPYRSPIYSFERRGHAYISAQN
ncbi:hypothetical protein L0156_30310 [bacterium]|nr:hypothetical protein [bacterium]